MATLLIETHEYRKFFPVARTRFLWDITTGIFTPYQRYEKQFHDVKVWSPRFEMEPWKHLREEMIDKVYNREQTVNTVVNSQFIPFENLSPQINRIGITKEGRFVYIRQESIQWEEIEQIIQGDIEPLLTKYKVKEIDEGVFLDNVTDLVTRNPHAIECDLYLIRSDSNYIQPNNNVYIDKNAKIQQFVSLQPDDGPIVIDKGTVVRSFSIIDGPCYIGKNSIIDSARIRGGTTIKDTCRIGGEVEESIVENFTNKHHEGFLGHSYVGSWVNIGAMATTSDLKNNYGGIRIEIDGKPMETGTNKFGSIICDWSKIGIGMMLNTGTVIEEGANLWHDGGKPGKSFAPFSWGAEGKYEEDRFVEDLRKMMSRRNVTMSESRERFIRSVMKGL
jgi:UDP-N-acetylglucosamine diphosphorylase/glucosamine-1-phosphate N-acetyltransferase